VQQVETHTDIDVSEIASPSPFVVCSIAGESVERVYIRDIIDAHVRGGHLVAVAD
jgi:hypothetical protein